MREHIITIGLLCGAFLGGCEVETLGGDTESADLAEAHASLSILAGYDLTTAPATATIGAAAAFDFVAPPGHAATDWVGIFPVGAANYQYLDWAYVPASTSGSVSVPLPASAVAGQTYEARYFLANGATHAATSPTFVAQAAQQPGGYAVTAPATAIVGQPVAFTFGAPAGHSTTDWIGIYAVGAPSYQLAAWAYVPPTTGGSVSITLPASATVGQSYEARYYLNNGYTQAATSSAFVAQTNVPPPPQGYTVDTPPPYVFFRDAVSVSWTAPANHATTDWIGLYRAGSSDSAVESWQYVGAAGATSGSMVFSLPWDSNLPPGTPYEIRYFVNNTYQRAATDAFAIASYYSGTEYRSGYDVGVEYRAPINRSATDWIGLYLPGAADGDFVAKAYVPQNGQESVEAKVTIPEATWSPDTTYEVRYFVNDSFVKAAPTISVKKQAILTGPEQFAVQSGQVTAVWRASPSHSPTDVIVVYLPGFGGFPVSSETPVGGAGQATGSVTFTLPANLTSGPYELHYRTLSCCDRARARSASFLVGDSYSVTGPAGPVAVGGTASGTWFASMGHSINDWVGLYEVGAPAGQYKAWSYLGPPSQQRGTVSLAIPGYVAPGTYELRYFLQGGYDLRSTSAPFAVTAP